MQSEVVEPEQPNLIQERCNSRELHIALNEICYISNIILSRLYLFYYLYYIYLLAKLFVFIMSNTCISELLFILELRGYGFYSDSSYLEGFRKFLVHMD